MLRIIHFLNDVKKKDVTTTPQTLVSTTAISMPQPKTKILINFIFRVLDEASKHGGIGGI